jgi:tetratricopeptide (TPR) repeat protein
MRPLVHPLLLVIALASAAPALGSATPAHAQDGASQSALDSEARSLFEAGRTAFEAGRFEAALERFREAYELSGRPALLYNVGTAADRLRRDAEALEAFRGYVAAVPDAPNRDEVEARIRVLEAAVAEDAARAAREQAPPTPEEVAVASEPSTELASPEASPGGGSVLEEWWFWTIVGVVVVGAGVGIGVGVASADAGTQAPLPGTGGVVFSALGMF